VKTIVIVGRPNVGKSSLFNRLTKTRDAIVADMPGLTRDRHYGRLNIEEHQFLLVDTGGFEPNKKDGIQKEMALQTLLAIDESDVLLFIVDAREGLHPIDQHIADVIRKNDKPKMLLINKAEGMQDDMVAADFHSLGFKSYLAISSAHGEGISQLRDYIVSYDGAPEKFAINQKIPKISIVGRPNVGKSTLINSLMGEERFIAFDQPGTTRDAVSVDFTYQGNPFTLTDTAGIRKKGKVFETVEKFSVIKTLNAIETSNVSILVVDSRDGISAQDMHILAYIIESGKSLVIALNKWDDISSYDKDRIKAEIEKKLPFVNFAEKVFISGIKKMGLQALMKSVIKAHQSALVKFTTSQLNDILENALISHPPKIIKGIRPKLKYAHQGGMNPPTIIIHGNHLSDIKKDYLRYLESFFRKAFDLTGTPLRIELKNSSNPFDDQAAAKSKKTGLVTRRKRIDDMRKQLKSKK
jgi:GTPase|tara:strand:+ start:1243 stop:2646 length:1404 start_codon:yes stop_codon:yes gene_type:complete